VIDARDSDVNANSPITLDALPRMETGIPSGLVNILGAKIYWTCSDPVATVPIAATVLALIALMMVCV